MEKLSSPVNHGPDTAPNQVAKHIFIEQAGQNDKAQQCMNKTEVSLFLPGFLLPNFVHV